MKTGILITRGAMITETLGLHTRWHLSVSIDTTVLEISALMSAFGLCCELADGASELKLYPIDYRPPPSAAALVDFYETQVGKLMPLTMCKGARFGGDVS